MNVTSGGLSFDISANNDKLKAIVEQSISELSDLSNAAKAGGKTMEAAQNQLAKTMAARADDISAALSKDRQELAKLQKQMEHAKQLTTIAYNSGADASIIKGYQDRAMAAEKAIAQKKQEIQTHQEAFSVLEQERQHMERITQATNNTAQASGSLRQQLRQVQEQLALLEETEGVGVRQTAKFKALQAEAGRLANALGDARTQAQIFSNDNAGLQSIIQGVGGVAGAFSAAQGAAALFGVENEALQKTMVRLQAAMAVTTGLQQVANMLNKDSYFRLVLVRKVTDFLTAANIRLAAALGISTAAAKALMATLTLGLSAAISAIIMALNKDSEQTKELGEQTDATKKAFEDFHRSTASKSADLVSKYQQLRNEYSKLKDDHERNEWIKANASAFDDLQLSVSNVIDADNIFVKNTDNVVKALELRAKALALQALQTQAYENYYNAIIEADNSVAGGGYYNKVNTNYTPTTTEIKGAKLTAGVDYYVETKQTLPAADMEVANLYGTGTTQVVGHLYQSGVDKLNAYRNQKAVETNQKIHEDAKNKLDETLDYSYKEIEQLQKQLDNLGLLKPGVNNNRDNNSTQSETERYAAEIEKRKKLYQQYVSWMTSGDATLQQAAAQQFAPLLEQGATYLEFLQNQAAELEKLPETAATKQNLELVRNEIAAATAGQAIDRFRTELQADLATCQTLGQQLDIIEKRRQEIADDNTEVGNTKRGILDEQQAATQQAIATETQELIQQYAGYEQQRYEFAQSYARRRELLERAVAAATTDQQKAIAQAALDNLNKEHEQWQAGTSELYGQLKAKYQTYEQQLADIQSRYAAERTEAQANNDTGMLAIINQKEQEEISKLAANQLMASESWTQLFGNLSRLSTSTITKLINDIEANVVTLSAQLSPTDMQAIMQQLNNAKNEVQKRNPFIALRDSLRALRKDAGTDGAGTAASLKPVFESLAGSIAFVRQSIDSVTNGLKTMRVTMDEETEAMLQSLNGIMTGAEQLATGIASSNPLGIIQGSVGLLSSAFSLFNTHDRKAEKSIKRHQEAVEKLKSAYADLEDAVNRALGEEYYTNQTALIKNLQAQQIEIAGMMADERDKKKTDNDRIEEWQDQYNELGREIKDIMDSITSSITQTTAKDLAGNLADALIDAFEGGKDAAEAFGEVANDVIKNAVINALKLQFLEKPLQDAIKQLQKDMGFADDGTGSFDGLTAEEQQRFKDAVEAAGANFSAAMEIYKGLFEQLEENDPTTLSGAIKGASQESIDLLAGQTNAVRQNQVATMALIRDQLLHLSNIDSNTAVIANRLQTIINQLNTPQAANFRSQGLTI